MEHRSFEELSSEQKTLVTAALKARENAYCPYSNFHVGAALRTTRGNVYSGCNVELVTIKGVHAEESAICHMILAGEREIQEIAVATTSNLSFVPCGSCRQSILEFGAEATVLGVDKTGQKIQFSRMSDLLPGAFPPGSLES